MIWLLLACRNPEETEPDLFPDDFLFGAAVAGFQVEAGCPTLPEAECTDPNSDWYQWVTDPGIQAEEAMYVTGDPLSASPGMWETFEDDVAIMQADGFSGFRMGIEWSRLFPDGAAEAATTVDELAAYADDAAVARYHEQLDALHAAGIEPLVTINHYTLPLWVHDGVACHEDPDACEADGWVDGERIERLIGLYAGFVAREYGGDVELWATLNEPLAVVLSGYLMPGKDRSNPPGLSMDGERTKAVLQHQIEGHAVMYDAVHAEDPSAQVGVVMNMTVIEPYADEEDDRQAAELVDHVYHAMFLDGITSGAWDDDADGVFETTRDDLAGRCDWIGINYYATIRVRGLPMAIVPEVPASTFYPEPDWIPHPEGIVTVVERTAEYGLPIYVTENGTSSDDADWRVQILDETLRELQTVAEEKDVRGYFYWSWVDNYEWNHGTSHYFFGLYELDPATKARASRPVMDRYREIVTAHGFGE